jgi:DNA replication protein DnaC
MSSINPPGVDRLAQLNALHLYGMAAAWSELLAEGPRRPVQPEAWLDRLIDAELADRHVRSLRYQLKAARFPAHRDLTGIDWVETPLPQAKIQQLASAAFMETAHNLILVGGTGTGKTHVATALGVAAVHHGKRVRFYNAVDLVNQLERETTGQGWKSGQTTGPDRRCHPNSMIRSRIRSASACAV